MFLLTKKIALFCSFKNSFIFSLQFQPNVHETSSLSIETVGERSVAKTESVPEVKETAFRAAKSGGFEPSVEEAGSMQESVIEDQQNATRGIVDKKEEQFLLRERQRGVRLPTIFYYYKINNPVGIS